MTPQNQIEEKGVSSAFIVWAVNTAALYLAAAMIPGVSYPHALYVPLAAIALWIATLVIEPFLYLLTMPINLATFGLFTIVIHGAVLLFVAKVSRAIVFDTEHFWGLFPAMLTALLISVFRLVARGLLVRLRASRQMQGKHESTHRTN